MTAETEARSMIERDLCNLAAARVNRALRGVIGLADSHEQAFVIASQAMGSVAGTLAGAFCRMNGVSPVSVDPLDVAIAVLQQVKAQQSARGSDGVPS